jgi:hypothetical protein
MAALEENKVLVLCQRKSGRDTDGSNIEKDVRNLESYISSRVTSPIIEYMSPGMSFDNENPDVTYKMLLSKRENKSNSEYFVINNKEKYKVIVIQTCPIINMIDVIPYLYNILQKDGEILFTAFKKGKEEFGTNNEMNKPFFSELEKYFTKVNDNVYIKKSGHVLGNRNRRKYNKNLKRTLKKSNYKRSLKKSTYKRMLRK